MLTDDAGPAERADALDPHPMRVLFLCTANSARSQMAEALLARKAGERAVVASAGSNPAAAVRPEAIEALRAAGIDWSARAPKGIEVVQDQPWDLVITLCDRMRESCPKLPGRPVFAHWGVPDPAQVVDPGQRAAAFRDALALISRRLDLMLALQPEALDRLVLGERLRQIARETTNHATT